MKILVFNGSPRQDGNTANLLKEVVAGAQEAASEAEVKFYDLNKLRFQGCQGCRACKSETAKGCVLTDDLTPIHQEMMEADALVFGSPIYMAGMSGQMKLFLDRMYGFTGPNWTNRLPAGKRGVVVITQGMADETAYQSVADLLDRMLTRRGFVSVESVIAGATKASYDELAAKEALAAKARQAGANLVAK